MVNTKFLRMKYRDKISSDAAQNVQVVEIYAQLAGQS
jgi:hypothetical protein